MTTPSSPPPPAPWAGSVPSTGGPVPPQQPRRRRRTVLLVAGLGGGLLVLLGLAVAAVVAGTGALSRPVIAGAQLAPGVARVLAAYQHPGPVQCPSTIPARAGTQAACHAGSATVPLQVQTGGQVLVFPPH